MLMRLIGKEKLMPLQNSDEEVQQWISTWVSEVISASWEYECVLLQRYPNVMVRGSNMYSFKVASSKFEVGVKIAFAQGIVLINSLSKT